MIHEIADRFPTIENTIYKEMVTRGERNYRLCGHLDRPRRQTRNREDRGQGRPKAVSPRNHGHLI